LTTGDGINWTLTLGIDSSDLRDGSQYVTFTEVRSNSDGKANSRIAPTTLNFCPATGCVAGLPTSPVGRCRRRRSTSTVRRAAVDVHRVANTTGLDLAATVT